MQFDELPNNCEPNSKSTVPPRCRCVALPKWVERLRQEVGIDTNAGIRHSDQHVITLYFQRHGHATSIGRELDGIHQQIPENLLQPSRVCTNAADVNRNIRAELNSLRKRRRPGDVERRLNDVRDINFL